MTVTGETYAYPFSDPHRLDLDPFYAKLRAEEPLCRVRLPHGEPAWLATRHEDVRTVLGDPRFSRAAALERDEPRMHAHHRRQGGILSMDPPDHTRLRRLVAKAFTMRRVELLRGRTQEIAEGLADAMAAGGDRADLVEQFALPLPITVICELLGVPFEDRGDFRIWSDAFLSTSKLTAQQVQDHIESMNGYMAHLIAERRERPTDDLLGALVRARDEDNGRLSEEELVQLAVGLLVAGHETTASQIPNFVYVLLTHPEELARLHRDPELVPRAVEELLRFVPLGAAGSFPRYALEDVEFGPVTVRAGEPVLVAAAAANRDPEVFAEPESLDLGRTDNPHVGFGHGPHHCLGAQLARMELQVALGTLLRRFPGLRFDGGADAVVWKTGLLVRGPSLMPVAW